MPLTKVQADAIYGNELYDKEYTDLISCLNRYDITTKQRMRHFLSQTAHESGGLKWLKELDSGHYLEWRTDLGNTQPGDGPKFKGAGVLQLTGRANYQKLANAVNDPKVMEIGCPYVAENYPMTSAGVWWQANDMNALCDRPDVTVRDVTLRVNGGTNGLSDRIHYYEKARKTYSLIQPRLFFTSWLTKRGVVRNFSNYILKATRPICCLFF